MSFLVSLYTNLKQHLGLEFIKCSNLGWVLVLALYVFSGASYGAILIVLYEALIGMFIYGLFKNKLPHQD
jgi:hypothetical protein